MRDLRDLDGVTVHALALGWDGSQTDDTDWSLDRSDLPRLTTQIGSLVVNRVEALGYTQYVVNGVPVDPATVTAVDYINDTIVAAGWEKVARDWQGQWVGQVGGTGPLIKPSPAYKAAHTKKKMAAAKKIAEANAAKIAVGIEQSMQDKWMADTAAINAKTLAEEKKIADWQKKVDQGIYPVDSTPADPWGDASTVKVADVPGLAAIANAKLPTVDEWKKANPLPGDSAGAAEWDSYFASQTAHKQAVAAQFVAKEKLSATANEKLPSKAEFDAAHPKPEPGLPVSAAYFQDLDAHNAKWAAKTAAKDALEAMPITHDELQSLLNNNEVKLSPAFDRIVKDAQVHAAKVASASALLTMDTASIPSPETLAIADNAALNSYVAANLSPAKYAAIHPTDIHEAAATIAAQHQSDHDTLQTLGYKSTNATALDAQQARRQVLRETGERKPTGGPSDSSTHTFYGDQIQSMSEDKAAAILVHHSGGDPHVTYGKTESEIRTNAITLDAAYKSTVTQLLDNGYAPQQIPHSLISATSMLAGTSEGFKSKSALASKGSASSVVAGSPTPMGKPANWSTMTSGKKSAWTKKYGKGAPFEGQGGGVTFVGKGATTAVYPNTKPKLPKQATLVIEPTIPLSTHVVNTDGSDSEQRKLWSAMIKTTESNDSVAHWARVQKAESLVTGVQKSAWNNYKGGGYTDINRCAKYGTGCTPGVKKQIEAMMSVYQDGTPAPKVLIRGKHRGPMADLNYTVGQTYGENGFQSFTTTSSTAKAFAGHGSAKRAVVTRILDSHGIISIPGTSGESETIMPRGTQYRVVAITDFKHGGQHLRYIDVEVVGIVPPA